MIRYARWKHSILLLPNSVGIPDRVFKRVKLSLHEKDHNKCKQHSVGDKKNIFSGTKLQEIYGNIENIFK